MFDKIFRPPPLLFAAALACFVAFYAQLPADAAPGGALDVPVLAMAGVVSLELGPAPAASDLAKGLGTSPSATGPALADPSNPGAFIGGLQEAARAGKWLLVLALICNALVWALRKLTPKILPKLGEWFGTDRGGTMLALATGVLSVVAVQAEAGRFDPWMLLSGLAAGLLAIGNHTAPKKAASTA
jgi:hypothetical protein